VSTASDGRPFAADPVVKAPGPLPKTWEERLVSCVVDENVGLPDAAVLTYRDDKHELLKDTKITIGTVLQVTVNTVQTNAAELLFSGEVTALELDGDQSSGSFTVIRAMSKAHRLFRGRKVEAFRNMTVAAIVRRVAKGAGLAVGRVEASPVVYPQLSQAGVSDWDFLQMLAQEHGCVVRVDEKGMLEFTKLDPAAKAPAPTTSATASPYVLQFGDNLQVLRASLTSVDQVSAVEVRGWNVATKKALVALENVVASKTIVPGMSPAKAQSAFSRRARLLVADTPYGSQAETAAAARSLAAATSAGFGEFEAVVDGNPLLHAGVPVALGNAGPDFSGRYTATAVQHVLEPGQGYRTTVQVSSSPDRSLAGLALGGNAPARSPRLPGLAIGVVTDIRDKGQCGWVKLKFPWLDDNYVTDWVRTVQLGGKGGGGVFSPEVNDEVLVGFEQGSLDRPYVLGGLYNGIDKPSPHDVPLVDGRSGKVNRRSFVSRKGNRVELLDGTTKSGVRLASGDKRLEVVLDEKTGKVAIKVYARGGRRELSSVTLTDRGITLDAGRGELTLKGRSVSITGTTSVSVDGGARAVLKGRIVEIN
jgi:uncharacterized protein involved in type VI secretion and phage assembly